MASDRQNETRKLTVETSDSVENFVTGCSGCYLVATADCYVAFDETADTGSLLIKANIVYPLENIKFTQIHALQTGGASSLHILAFR